MMKHSLFDDPKVEVAAEQSAVALQNLKEAYAAHPNKELGDILLAAEELARKINNLKE